MWTHTCMPTRATWLLPPCGCTARLAPRCRHLEAEGEMERTYRLKQKDLAREVDVTSASKVGGQC